MKKPLYLRLDEFSHNAIDEMLLQRVASSKTDIVQQALDFYLKYNLTKEEYKNFIIKQRVGDFHE